MAVSVEEIENLISQLPNNQLKEFRAWYQKFDSEIWDKQIKQDIMSGALDELAEKAIADHKAGR